MRRIVSQRSCVFATTLLVCLVGHAAPLSAQGVEFTPFGGYRFGGDFFELLTRQPIDLDGAPAIGLIVDVPTARGFQIEGFFTRQDAHISVPAFPVGPAIRKHFTVDHWQGGGLQEFGTQKVRPFLTGTLGLTRYATEGDDEIRFALSVGGGVKLFPSSHVGVRLSGSVFATFVDAETQFFACSSSGCLIGFDTNVVWQVEFTAGLIVRVP